MLPDPGIVLEKSLDVIAINDNVLTSDRYTICVYSSLRFTIIII